jgi:hypothetical protein
MSTHGGKEEHNYLKRSALIPVVFGLWLRRKNKKQRKEEYVHFIALFFYKGNFHSIQMDCL